MNKTKIAETTLAVGIFILASVFASALETGFGSVFAQNQKISNQIKNSIAMNPKTATPIGNNATTNRLSTSNSTNDAQQGIGSIKQLENLIGNNTQELANSSLANMTANVTGKMANMTATIPQKIENIRNVTFGNQTKKE